MGTGGGGTLFGTDQADGLLPWQSAGSPGSGPERASAEEGCTIPYLALQAAEDYEVRRGELNLHQALPARLRNPCP